MDYSFTIHEDQVKRLVTLIYLGNWLINGVRTYDEKIEDFDLIAQAVYAQLLQLGLSGVIAQDSDTQELYPAFDAENEILVQKLIEEYDEEIFWYELIHRMAARDLYLNHSEDELQEMGEKDMNSIQSEYLRKYADEFKQSGIDRMGILE